MKELSNVQNNDSIASEQKDKGNKKRVLKKRLSKYNFKEVDADQSKKSVPKRSESYNLAALSLFKDKSK